MVEMFFYVISWKLHKIYFFYVCKSLFENVKTVTFLKSIILVKFDFCCMITIEIDLHVVYNQIKKGTTMQIQKLYRSV